MTSRNLLNLVLLVVVTGLIAIVVFEPGVKPKSVNPRLTTLKQDDITHIMIQREADDDIELEKVNGNWQLLRPYRLAAHDFRVQTILRLAEAESHSQNDLSKLDKTTFGLDKPNATVTFNKTQQIIFGNNEPLQQLRYVKSGNTLHTIVDTFYYQVISRVSTFMDHKLLPGQGNIIKLVSPELVVELKDGKWQLQPEPGSYSADDITELLNNWRTIQAIEIDKTKPVSNKHVISIFLKEQQTPLEFTVVKNESGIALVRNDLGLAYSISEDNYQKLTHLPESKKSIETE